MIYLDNAATTQLCDAALSAMCSCLAQEYGNPSSLHSLGQRAGSALYEARRSMADCLGCSPRELIFCSGGTEANNQALYSAADWGRKNGRLHILSTAVEHHAVLRVLSELEQQGFTVELLPVNAQHSISVQQVAAALRPDTCLVSIMLANNEIGSLFPVEEIARLCRQRGVLCHTDAVQAVGHIPVDVARLGVDYLSLSAHKFHGPKGIGALYCRRGVPLQPLLLGGGQERGQRGGTENLPAIVGMAAALRDCCATLEQDISRISALKQELLEGLSQLKGVSFNGNPDAQLPGLVNLCIDGIESESLLLLLDQGGICAGAGAACSAGALEPSHVLLALGRSPTEAQSALRLSLSRYSTQKEVQALLQLLPGLVQRLRRMKGSFQG